MASQQNKNKSSKSKKPHFSRRHAVSSSSLHQPRTRFAIFHPSTIAGKIIFATIVIAILAVIVALVCSILFTPERITKSYLDTLASDYYEQYYYEQFSNSDRFKSLTDLNSVMSKYTESGFANTSLRQLILRDATATKPLADYILKYCDEQSTYVTFYPEPPYDRTSYHAEFTYSCDF